MTCIKISRWRTWDMNFPIQSNPQVAFLCDRIFRLFVTVVQFDGIFMRFSGPSSRFTFSNCHGSTVMQIRSTVAGKYGIRRLQVKRCGRLDLGAVLALDCCCVPGTWSGFTPKVHVVHSKDQGLLPFVICFRFDDYHRGRRRIHGP